MPRTTLPALALAFFLLPAILCAQDSNYIRKQYTTQRATAAINIDGIPDEAAWDAVPFGGDYTQYQPADGKPPSQPTQFKILYDDKYLYVAYWAHEVSFAPVPVFTKRKESGMVYQSQVARFAEYLRPVKIICVIRDSLFV